jgi:hypothetical protein
MMKVHRREKYSVTKYRYGITKYMPGVPWDPNRPTQGKSDLENHNGKFGFLPYRLAIKSGMHKTINKL